MSEVPLYMWLEASAELTQFVSARLSETSARYRAVEPSSGSNVIPRRARPGLAGLRPHSQGPCCPMSAPASGDATPCRMTGVTLHSHVHYEEIQARTCPSARMLWPREGLHDS